MAKEQQTGQKQKKEKKSKEALLKIKKELLKRKPVFKRHAYHRKKRLGKMWRRPRGLHSKMRLQRKGHRNVVSVGYRTPAALRGMHISGLEQIIVHNTSELSKINPSTQGIIVANVGEKKRIDILKEALKLKIRVINYKDPASYLKSIEEQMKKKKDEKSLKEEEKKKKKDELKKKAEEKAKEKKLEEALTDEEKKEKEKEEKDKVLTKKDSQ